MLVLDFLLNILRSDIVGDVEVDVEKVWDEGEAQGDGPWSIIKGIVGGQTRVVNVFSEGPYSSARVNG